jgi:hypothetical protein
MLVALPASAKMTKCRMTYSLKGWSLIYKTSTGTGQIRCSNGQRASVRITTHGGGLSVGTSEVVDGRGVFSQVRRIDELFGGYAEVDAHAGAGAASDARTMMSRRANLSLVGTGHGISLGVALGSFSIHPM